MALKSKHQIDLVQVRDQGRSIGMIFSVMHMHIPSCNLKLYPIIH